VNRVCCLPLLLIGALSGLQADDLKPETAAAFGRYIKLTEANFDAQKGFEDFLWLDHHPNEKSLVWLQQSVVKPLQTLDQGKEIEVPDGVIQHWLGATYLENTDIEKMRATVINFAPYKDWFRAQIIQSNLTRHEGDTTDVAFRFYKKQFKTMVLNVNETCKYIPIDEQRFRAVCHSTHVGEAEYPKNKKKLDQERAPEDAAGYLWRLNFYWRIQQADNGCYVELEVISLARQEGGRLSPSRYLTGFQSFPQDLTQYLIDTMEVLYPHHK
jgi:hypothetical protein